jgi:hypothetical protein
MFWFKQSAVLEDGVGSEMSSLVITEQLVLFIRLLHTQLQLFPFTVSWHGVVTLKVLTATKGIKQRHSLMS